MIEKKLAFRRTAQKSEVMKTLGKFAPNACVAVPGNENAPRLATRSVAK
jgi:hypothetical protein